MTIKTIRDPIYKVDITFIFNETKKKTIDYLKNKISDKKDRSDIWDTSAGFFIADGAHEFYLILTDYQKELISTLVHECLHIVANIMRYRFIKLTTSSEEAYTYYLAWLVGKLLKIYQSKPSRNQKMKTKSKALTKADLKKFAAKDKKDDKKMIKDAMKKKRK